MSSSSKYFMKPNTNKLIVPPSYLPESYRKDISTSKHKLIDLSTTSPPLPASNKTLVPESEDSDAEGSIESQNDKIKKKTRRIALESSEEEQEKEIEAQPRPARRTRRKIDSDDSDEQISIIAPVGSKKSANKRPRLASSSASESDSDPDCSIAVISRPKTRPTTKKLRRKIDLGSDDDQEANLDSEQDEWKRARSEAGSDEDDHHHQRVSEDDAIRFFNSCDVADLPAVTACTLEQAKMIVGCRPFKDAEDMRSKLRKKKGVNSGILTHYQDMMKGYFEVDRVLSKCEKHGQDLSSIMNIWAGRVQSSSETGKTEEEGATDLVDHLTDAQGLRTEEERKAFADYIYRQPPSVPKKITLKSYQMLGINWMNLLYSKGLSCILADEMGLGKTAQVVCFLSQLKLAGQPGPHLVVGHQLKNSQSKRYKDLMRMQVGWRLLLTGTPLQNNLQELVSLLSFILPKIFGGQAQQDLRMIFKVPSEAQVNLLAQTRITRAKKMMSPFVLRRKKTQVLKELPRKIEKVVYCDLEPSQAEAYNQLVKKSKKYLINSSVDEDFEHLEEEEEIAGFKKNGLLGGNGTATGKKSPGKKAIANSTTNVLMELRKVSNHPLLFRRQYDETMLRKIAKGCLNEVSFFDCSVDLIVEDLEVMSDYEIDYFCGQYKSLRRFQLPRDEFFNSGKVKTLQHLLGLNKHSDTGDGKQPPKPSDSRFLIFSQFTQMLDILKVVLTLLNVKFVVLTGQTNVTERQSLVDEFTQDPTITVFLLSTRAGGLGLNLMAADTVILFDQDFNPHNDRQAEDRAYRLGQTRDVTVYKLISKGTIEEDILQLAATKIEIDNSISNNPGPSTTASDPLAVPGPPADPSSSAAAAAKDGPPEPLPLFTQASQAGADASVKKSLIHRFRTRVLSAAADS
ncbi:hypothetical protein PtB15_12B130 [Puccinia triticina]|nr:hypothetical protein PtB15_12B130 [Puccinia triticina]